MILVMMYDEPGAQDDQTRVREAWDNWVIDPDEFSEAGQWPVRPFPLDHLPPWIRGHVVGIAGSTQTPPDYAAVLSLVCLSGVCGGRVEVRASEKWREGVSLYGVIVADPGSRKTAVFDQVFEPLRQWERQLRSAKAAAYLEAKVDADLKRAAANKARKAAEDDLDDEELVQAAKDAEAAAAEAQRKIESVPTVVLGDVTPEELAVKMAENNGRAVLISDEGGVFGMLAGRYSAQPNLDIFLQAWSGSMVKVSRRNLDVPIEIDRPALTIGLAVQPKTIGDVLANAHFGGRGLIDRFLIVEPDTTLGSRDHRAGRAVANDPATKTASDLYVSQMLTLAASLDAADDSLVLSVDGPASDLLIDWMQANEPRLLPGGEFHSIAGLVSKMPGNVLRMAGLLTVSEQIGAKTLPTTVSPDAMARAIDLGDYFLGYTLRLRGELTTSPLSEPARLLLKWLRDKWHENVVTVRPITQRMRPVFPKASGAMDAIKELEAAGYLQRLPSEPRVPGQTRGRDRDPGWALHPSLVFSGQAPARQPTP